MEANDETGLPTMFRSCDGEEFCFRGFLPQNGGCGVLVLYSDGIDGRVLAIDASDFFGSCRDSASNYVRRFTLIQP